MDEFVVGLRAMRERVIKDEAAWKEMCKPILDISYAGWLRARIADNDIFLIVAIRIFTPRTFAGKRMECGSVRDEICKYMGINKWSVSKRVKLVLFYYDNIRNFRRKANLKYKNIIAEAVSLGILKDCKKYL